MHNGLLFQQLLSDIAIIFHFSFPHIDALRML